MPEQKHIDDLFREKMGSHNEAPPSFVWKNLEQKLDSTVTPGNVVSYYKWLRYGVILSALVVLVYFSGRKLMEASDAKQTAAEQVAAGNAQHNQNNEVLNTGNAVAGNEQTNTVVNGTANEGDQANGNSIAAANTTQEQAIQNQSGTPESATNTNGSLLAANTNTSPAMTGRGANANPNTAQAQAADHNMAANKQSANGDQATAANSNTAAGHKTASTSNNTQPNVKTAAGNTGIAAANQNGTPGHATAAAVKNAYALPKSSANNTTVVTANQNTAAAHKTASASNNSQARVAPSANNTTVVTANQNTAAAHKTASASNNSQARVASSARNTTVVAANQKTAAAHKITSTAKTVQSLALNKAHTIASANTSKQPKPPISNSLHKSNIQPYAARKEEYAQNSLKSESGRQIARNSKNNIPSSSEPANTRSLDADGLKTNTVAAHKNSNVGGNGTAADAIKGNKAFTALANSGNNENANGTQAKNSQQQNSTAANNTQPAAGNSPVASNNAPQSGIKPTANSNKGQPVNPAANSGTKANTKPVSTPEFIDNLVAKNAAHKSKAMHRTPMFETGFKLGYELGFQHFAANKYVIAPYVEYSVGKLGVMIQPAFKYARNGHTSNLGAQENYYNVTSQPFSTPPAIYVQTIDTNHPNPMYIRRVTYSEKHDSIVINHHIDTKSYTEIEIPVLFKYNANQNFAFYGGVVFDYSNSVIQVKEDRQTYSTNGVYSYKDSFNVGSPEPVMPDPNSVFQYGGISYIKYSNADYQSASSMKLNIGYMLGFSYTIKDRYMLDVSMQQNLSNMNYVPNKDVRGIYTQPYFRISAGYKLFKSK